MFRMRSLFVLLTSSLAALLLIAVPTTTLPATAAVTSVSAVSAASVGPRHYYLSIGDSFAFGLQLGELQALIASGNYTPDAFNTGFTDDVASMIRQWLRPDLAVVNYSCPVTGTAEMISTDPDACLFHSFGLALHDEWIGSQLGAAVAFLHAHPGQVSPITVSVGGADISSAINDCSADFACVARSGVFQKVRTNMTVMYNQLRAAAPDADIVYLVPHNITIIDFSGSNPSWSAFDLEMRALAVAHRVKVADAFAAITLAGRTCELTFMCLPPDQSDSHPNDAGYAVMAQLIIQAAHYNIR